MEVVTMLVIGVSCFVCGYLIRDTVSEAEREKAHHDGVLDGIEMAKRFLEAQPGRRRGH